MSKILRSLVQRRSSRRLLDVMLACDGVVEDEAA